MMRPSTVLLALTMLLVLVGTVLYVNGLIGWAQACWALASGTAGAGVAAWLTEHPQDGE